MIDEQDIKIMVDLIDNKLKGYTGENEELERYAVPVQNVRTHVSESLRIIKRTLEFVLERNDNPFIDKEDKKNDRTELYKEKVR